MYEKLKSHSSAWYYVFLCSLLTNRSIFGVDLSEHANQLQSTALAETKPLLAREYQTILDINRLTRPIQMFGALIRLASLTFTAKALFYLYVMHVKFSIFSRDTRLAVERNHQNKLNYSSPATYYSYGCIKSNCSSLFDPQQVNTIWAELNLDRLPIFAICYPHLHYFYEPFQHVFGTGTTFFITYTIYLFGIDLASVTFAQNIFRNNSAMFFMLAPNLARKVLLERAREHLIMIRYSYANYLNVCRAQQLERSETLSCENGKKVSGGQRYRNSSKNKYLPPVLTVASLVPHSENTNYASDCLPLIRSNWWHKILVTTTRQILYALLISMLLASLLVIFYSSYTAGKVIGVVHELHRSMVRENCSIWQNQYNNSNYFLGGDGRDATIINMVNIDIGLNTYTSMTLFFCTGCWPWIWGNTVVITFVVSGWELRCWCCELQYKLTLVKSVIGDLYQWPNEHGVRRNDRGQLELLEPNLVFRFDKFRTQFMKEIHPVWPLVPHRSFIRYTKQKDSNRILMENYYPSARPDQRLADRERDLAEQLEKLYVELRLMIGLKDEFEQNISILTVLAIMANYTVSVVSIYVVKILHGFPYDQMFLVILGITLPMIMIFNLVTMNTQMLKLGPLLSSIITDLCLSHGRRLGHIRVLWQKLVDDFNPNIRASGGPLRIRFTYVSMIQILLTVATMFLFILKT